MVAPNRHAGNTGTDHGIFYAGRLNKKSALFSADFLLPFTDFFQVAADLDALGTDFFAGAADDAVTGMGFVCREAYFCLRTGDFCCQDFVIKGENIGDGDGLGADLRAVAAACAG